MPPAVVAGAPRKVIDPYKPGKFSVKIGDSLKESSNGRKQLTSLKYNHKPSPALNNGRKSILKPKSGGLGNEVTVEISPNDTAEPPITFTGAQGPSKKTECVLIYDPATGTFTLEKLLSTFTLNLTSAGANIHPPLTLPKYNPDQSDDDGASDDGSSDGDATKADKENPFDYRHFINNKFEVPTTSSRLRDDKDRKQRLEKFHEELDDPNASESEDEMEEDTTGGLIIEENPTLAPPLIRQTLPARPKATPTAARPRAKATPKTPAANKRSAASGPVSFSSAVRKGAIPTESIDLTPSSTSHPQNGHKRTRDEQMSSESDADIESEESDVDEDEDEAFANSGELIVEGEEVEDNRNNRSRSTTAGINTSWMNGNRGSAQDVDMDSSDDEGDGTTHTHAPSPYDAPISLTALGNLDEDDTSGSDPEPRGLLQHQQQMQQSAPTPSGNAAEDEYEEEEEFDLAGMLEEALENGEEEEEEESESEEE